MSVRISIRARSVLGSVPRAMNAAGGDLIHRGLRVGEATAKRESPVRTGFLRSTIGMRMTSTSSGVLYAKANYAAHVNYGTRFMAGRPFMNRGAEAAERYVLDHAREIERRLPSV